MVSKCTDDQLTTLNGIYLRIANTILYKYLLPSERSAKNYWLTPTVSQFIFATLFSSFSVSFFVMQVMSAQFAKDSLSMANAIAMGIGGLTFLVRTWTLIRSPSNVRDTIFMDFTEFRCNLYRKERALRILFEGYRHVERANATLHVASLMNYLSWLVLPLFPMAYLYATGTSYEEISRNFPTSVMAKTDWGYHEIRFAYEIIVIASLIELWNSSSALYYTAVHMIHVQYLVLADSVKRLLVDTCDEPSVPMSIDDFVRDQLKLRRYSIQLSRHLSPLLAVTLVNAVFSISLNLATLLTQSENTSQSGVLIAYMKFVIYFMITVSEITMYCMLSEKLNASNSSIASAIYYDLDWQTGLMGRSKQNCLLPMVICRREIRLYASEMVSLRISTAVEILKFSYSYCAILTNKK